MNSRTQLVVAMLLLLVLAGCEKALNDPAPKPVPASVTDIDGNLYHTVVIGQQAWLQENLATTRYQNGDSLRIAAGIAEWSGGAEGACCSYLNNDENATKFGRLYNRQAVADSRGVCPAGWHVPTEAEWSALAAFLGGAAVAGGKLKAAGTADWMDPNAGATNGSGFNALPAGYRDDQGIFGNLHASTVFWTSTEHDSAHGWYRYMYYDRENLFKDFYHNMSHGFSVRCIRDR